MGAWTFLFIGKLPPVEYKVFKEYYGHLKSILSAQNLSQYLVSADVITFQDEEEICAARTSFAKATILLQRLAGPLEHGDTNGFYQLLRAMEDHGNMATKDLATKMKNTVSSLQKGQPISISSEPTQPASQSLVVAYQSSSLPQETNAMSLASAPSTANAAINDSESYEIVDLKGAVWADGVLHIVFEHIAIYSHIAICDWIMVNRHFMWEYGFSSKGICTCNHICT